MSEAALSEYFQLVHKNKGLIEFVNNLEKEVGDIDTFINSMNGDEPILFFQLMLDSIQD